MVTKEEIQKIAALSKLYVQEDALEDLTRDMNRIIAFAAQVQEASQGAQAFDHILPLSNVLREDVVSPSFPREEILAPAGGGEGGYFPVKKARR